MLEAAGFDFRNRHPQEMLIKFARVFLGINVSVSETAYSICVDLYRTYVPLKQITSAMVISCLELSARLHDEEVTGLESSRNYDKTSTSREDVMGKSLLGKLLVRI